MIIRVVKMIFEPEHLDDFLQNFNRNKESIRNFPGCKKLELLQESDRPNVYFTYSWWESEDDLENYRQSDLFKGVWKLTKTWFSDKPQAWSLIRKIEVK